MCMTTGGHNGLSIFSTVECYNPQDRTWSAVAPMHSRRCRAGVATLNSKLYRYYAIPLEVGLEHIHHVYVCMTCTLSPRRLAYTMCDTLHCMPAVLVAMMGSHSLIR